MTLTTGQRLHYVDVGQGPVLLLLHGWGMSSGVFAALLPELARDFRLLIPDLRGHGQSDPGPGYALHDFSADTVEWLSRLGVTECHLLGWSFGGQLALRLAADRSIPLVKMILVAATPRFCQGADWRYGLQEGQVRAMERQLRRDPVTTLTAFVDLMFSGESVAADCRAKTLRQLVWPDAGAVAQTLTTLRETDQRGELAVIEYPTLVHHGQNDQIIPAAAGEFLAGHLSQSELCVWDGIGHAPFMSCPERSLALWRNFLL